MIHLTGLPSLQHLEKAFHSNRAEVLVTLTSARCTRRTYMNPIHPRAGPKMVHARQSYWNPLRGVPCTIRLSSWAVEMPSENSVF